MTMTELRDYTRRFFGAHGAKAELEAARKPPPASGRASAPMPVTGAASSRRKEMRGPHVS